MKLRSARILLSVFALSISLNQVIEIGHGILHSFENPVHYHKARKHKDFKDHSLVDHHFPKMKFAHEMDKPQTPGNFIALAFVFFQAFNDFDFTHSAFSKTLHAIVLEHDYLVYHSPPTPPPLVVA